MLASGQRLGIYQKGHKKTFWGDRSVFILECWLHRCQIHQIIQLRLVYFNIYKLHFDEERENEIIYIKLQQVPSKQWMLYFSHSVTI